MGNQTGTAIINVTNFTGQSFTPNVGGSAADANFSVVLGQNPSQVYLTNFTFTGFSGTAPTLLNIYASSNRTNLVTSSISNSGFSYSFEGLTPLTFGATYFAFYPNNEAVTIRRSSTNVYAGGNLSLNGATVPLDTTFTATFSDTDPTPVPFEFDPTGAVVILGGLWGLKRLVQKKLKS